VKIEHYENMIDFHEYDDYNLSEALNFGIQILQDGQNTIYNPDWPPYEEIQPKGGAFWVGVAIVDVIGGIMGGLEHYDGWGWDWAEAGLGALGASAAMVVGRFFGR